MRKGPDIQRGAVGANVSGKPFKTSGLLASGVAVAGKLTLGTVYTLYSVTDAESLGLNAAYDTTNNVVLYQHIVDFYDECGAGVPLYLLVVAQTTTIDTMVDVTETDYAKKLIQEGAGDIYNLGVAFNPEASYTETTTDGLNSDVRAAIANAQALWEWSAETDREVQIVLEGRGVEGTAATSLNLRAIPADPTGIEENHKVSIVIGQDYDFAETLTGLAQKYAGVGKKLGTIAACEVNQDTGEVGLFNLTRSTKNRWTTAGLSNHVKVKDAEAQLDTYDTKGYIFADTYQGVSGYRWNGDHVCAPVIVDEDDNMNEHSIKLGRTTNHARRELRKQLLPHVRSVKPSDPTTGKMAQPILKWLEGIGDDVFEDLADLGYLTEGKTTVDPDSDIQVAKEVKASFEFVPYGTIEKISGTINVKKNF